MAVLTISDQDNIRELRLTRPPVNALDPGLVQALRVAVEQAPGEDVDGLVLCGAPGLFSAGLDLPTLLTLDRGAMRDFWQDFFGLCAALACSPIPVVAAVAGHSPAGGAVLALYCDYRVMARGEFRIGLNEVQVGLIVPEVIQLAMRRNVGPRQAERLLVAGRMLDPEQALACGLVDELAEADAVDARAHDWLRQHLALPRQAMLTTRALARADLVRAFDDRQALPVDDFLKVWFSTPTQATLHEVVARLRSKSAG